MTPPNQPHDTQIRPYGEAAIAEAAELIERGLPLAIPTETVYGLAGDASNAFAVANIYDAKGRPRLNPLIVHVLNQSVAEAIGLFDQQASALARQYWPGPLTLVVPFRDGWPIPEITRAGLSTIALRVPAHPAMRALLEACGMPLAAPSANMSGRISPTRAEHVLASLDGRIPLIIDAGPTAGGIESTIIAATDGTLRLLRKGPIEVPEAVDQHGGHIEAPGQLASHYAPAKPLRLNASAPEDDEFMIGFGPVQGDVSLSDAGDPVEAAARLFDLLHQADAAPQARIAVAPIPATGLGAAISDRLMRAAAPR